MELFKVLILAVTTPFAKVSVYLFEKAEQTFPLSRYWFICDKISTVERDLVIPKFIMQYQNFLMQSFKILLSHFHSNSLENLKVNRCVEKKILIANSWKSEYWYLDYIEISASKTSSVLNFAWQWSRLQVKTEVGFEWPYFYFTTL